jgi:hypothetical protein
MRDFYRVFPVFSISQKMYELSVSPLLKAGLMAQLKIVATEKTLKQSKMIDTKNLLFLNRKF